MKPIRTTRIVSLFMVCCLIMATFAAPVSLALVKEKDITMVESSDWKVVKVNGKKAFKLSPKSFSDAYDTLASRLAKTDDDRAMLLLNYGQAGPGIHVKFCTTGSLIRINSVKKNSKTADDNANITSIEVDVSPFKASSDSMNEMVMISSLMVITSYDGDITAAILKKIKTAINDGKSKAAFTWGDMKFVVTFPDFSYCNIKVTPK